MNRREKIEPLLTIDQVAELLGGEIGPRFVRRLIAERRIVFVKVGRHIRIPESAVADFIAAGTVRPASARRGRVA